MIINARLINIIKGVAYAIKAAGQKISGGTKLHRYTNKVTTRIVILNILPKRLSLFEFKYSKNTYKYDCQMAIFCRKTINCINLYEHIRDTP